MVTNDTFVSWKAYWTGGIAITTIVITIVIALGGLHISRPHKNAVTNDSLKEHVSTARQERKDISLKIDHIEDSVHKVEIEQAKITETLDRVYEEVRK